MKLLGLISIVCFTFEGYICADIPFKHGTEVIKGYGGRKQAVIKCGGNALDLAVGMLEGPMTGTGYPYGDHKTGDSANFGMFKQNWDMIRKARPEWSHLQAKDYNTGAKLNTDVCLDVDTLHRSQKRLGMDMWFAGHRAGASGKPSDKTVKDYRLSVEWIRDQINKDFHKFSTDDTRIWVEQPPIY